MQNETITEKLKKFIVGNVKKTVASSAVAILLFSFMFGFFGGIAAYYVAPTFISRDYSPAELFNNLILRQGFQEKDNKNINVYKSQEKTIEEKIIDVVKRSSGSVVSVIATKDLLISEQYLYSPFGDIFPEFQIPQLRERSFKNQQVSSGSGFVIGNNLIVTNKHVVSDTAAQYTVVTMSGEKISAEVIARHPVEDLAILKVENINLPALVLGDSSALQIGQTVIAIGNALGEFENSVSVGVVSGLRRTLTASGPSGNEILREVIQTDAAINFGNSGGPLINLLGEIIGINSAIATGAENIGFAIPINRIKNSLAQIETTGEIKYPFLGVRHIMINLEIQKENNLPFDYGALIVRGSQSDQIAVSPGSAADKAGILENNIILEINGERIDVSNPLVVAINKFMVGDTVNLKLYDRGEEKLITVVLGERP